MNVLCGICMNLNQLSYSMRAQGAAAYTPLARAAALTDETRRDDSVENLPSARAGHSPQSLPNLFDSALVDAVLASRGIQMHRHQSE